MNTIQYQFYAFIQAPLSFIPIISLILICYIWFRVTLAFLGFGYHIGSVISLVFLV